MAESTGITETFMEVELKPGVHLQIGTNKGWWRVLEIDREKETALLIANTQVAEKSYHDNRESITWENCTLRAWLNGEFYQNTFSEEEKAAIVETALENPSNPKYGTTGGNPTTDRIFLLGMDEAEKYFQHDRDRSTGVSWWLRSPGDISSRSSCVTSNGNVGSSGYYVNYRAGVHPAFRINLKSDLFQSFIVSESRNAVILRVPELSIQGGCVIKASPYVTAVEIPNGVTAVGRNAFSNCTDLTSVIIPEGVTYIGVNVFNNCISLKSVTIPQSVSVIDYGVFSCCFGLERVELGSVNITFADEDPFEDCSKCCIVLPNGSARTKQRLPASLNKACRSFDEEDLAWILLYQTAKSWRSEGIAAAKAKEPKIVIEKQLSLISNMVKVSSAAASNALETFSALSREVPADTVKRFAALLEEKKCEKQLEALKKDPVLREKLLGSDAEKGMNRAEIEVKNIMDAEGMTQPVLYEKVKLMYSLKVDNLPELLDANGETCGPFVLAWLLTAHETTNYYGAAINWQYPGLRPEAEKIVGLLKKESLQSVILSLADEYLKKYQNQKKKFLTYPFCRYADEASMAEITRRAPKWATSVSGNEAPPLLQLREALIYSNTRAAMLFADRNSDLNKYAALRGLSEEDLRDRYLSDVGLDELGGKSYDLGNQTVTARLQKDLSFLFELPNRKTAKSLPKKNADPGKYEAAKADFDEMRKSVKKIVKGRKDFLFQSFLNRDERKATDWKEAYLKNPLLRGVAELLVWNQGGNNFTILNGKPVDSAEQPYEITDLPVSVAHPMEMSAGEVKAWQKYFTRYGLKQPFLQIWEPVIDSGSIKESRYSGAVLPMYRFSGKEKHGIHAGSLLAYSTDIGFSLDDCKLEYEGSTWRIGYDGADGETYTLGKFSFDQYTRKVNHIVSLLDSWTVEDRIKKDDISVADRLDSFTLAQITGFIKLAQEANAVSVLALLMDYKNRNYAEFDPMDEFTLG